MTIRLNRLAFLSGCLIIGPVVALLVAVSAPTNAQDFDIRRGVGRPPANGQQAALLAAQAARVAGSAQVRVLTHYAQCLSQGYIQPDTDFLDGIPREPQTPFQAVLVVMREYRDSGAGAGDALFEYFASQCWAVGTSAPLAEMGGQSDSVERRIEDLLGELQLRLEQIDQRLQRIERLLLSPPARDEQ